MTSDLKHIYHDKYINIDNDSFDEKNVNEEDNLNIIPTGWSFICLDETITYYTDHLSKDSSKA